MNNEIRVLYILGGAMQYGGTEAFIMNYYRGLDKNKVIIDFIYQGEQEGVYDQELLSNGSKIFHVPNKLRHPVAFSMAVKNIIKSNNYKIVHSQMDAMGAWPLLIAKIVGVPIRIAHSHNTSHQTNSKIKLLINDFAKLILRKVSTHCFACGEEAGRWLFGDKMFDDGNVKVIHNAIDLNKYAYSIEKRKEFRDEFNISNEDIVVGHIGQFREQKNHKKIISIFNELLKTNAKYKLVLVGAGDLVNEIKDICKNLGILDKVIFTGARNDVYDIMNIFDVFLFPSLFEGLSFVAIEVQANGIPCVFSNTIANETIINKNVFVEDLQADDALWVKTIDKALEFGRINNNDDINEKGYNIIIESSNLEKEYLSLYNNI